MVKRLQGQQDQSYGLPQPITNIFPTPVVSRRAPSTLDTGYSIGQIWVNRTTAAVYCLSSNAGGIATWAVLGGPGADVNTLSGDAGGVISPVLGNIVLAGGTKIATSGAGNTITFNLDAGTTAIRSTEVVEAGNFLQSYAVTTGLAVGTTYRAFRGDLSQVTGDGTESPQAIRGALGIDVAGDVEEGYGGYFNATQADGSAIDSNLIGSLGITTINEVDPADQPQQWIAGTQSIVAFDAAAGIPTAAIVAGSISHVMYDAAMNTLAHAYVASRNGGGAGGTAGSAFKVLSGGAIEDWSYGLDLDTGGAGAAALYGTADIRLANELIIHSINATDTYVTCPADGRLDIQLGDAVGVESFSIRSNAPALVAEINSLGELTNTNVECGNNLGRITEYTSNLAVIQAYANDDTAAGISSRNAIIGSLQPTSGDGNSQINGILGELDNTAGANTLMVFGVRGYCRQEDGSVIASTAAGVEGWLNLLETDAGDLPAYAAFGVKGYLDSTDGAGVPTGMCAGVGSIVEYNTPFNAKAYGFLATRLNMGAGAGTAGHAAYGVLQGTVAASDWLYGIDLASGVQDYTTADIRLWNEALIDSSAAGVLFSSVAGDNWTFQMGDAIGVNKVSFTNSATAERAAISSLGDITSRNINVTNTNITSFNVNPLLQTKATTGGVPTGATGDYNVMYCQDGVTMEQFILGAGQTIIAPRLNDAGLLISLDLVNAEGAEYYFGHTTRSRHTFTVGTSPAFFVEATFTVADAGSSDPLWLGFRKLGAPNADYTTYTDAGVIGLHQTTNADTVIVGSNLNGAGWAYVNTTDAFTDGQTHKLRVNVSAAGVVTYLIDGVAPTVPQALTFDATDVVVPFIHHLFIGAGGAPGAINLTQFACGLQ